MELPLNLHPFAFMDVTYYGDTYLNVGAEEALVAMKQWVPVVKTVGGTLISVWHNRTFSQFEPQWKDWAEVYKSFIDAAKS